MDYKIVITEDYMTTDDLKQAISLDGENFSQEHSGILHECFSLQERTGKTNYHWARYAGETQMNGYISTFAIKPEIWQAVKERREINGKLISDTGVFEFALDPKTLKAGDNVVLYISSMVSKATNGVRDHRVFKALANVGITGAINQLEDLGVNVQEIVGEYSTDGKRVAQKWGEQTSFGRTVDGELEIMSMPTREYKKFLDTISTKTAQVPLREKFKSVEPTCK